MQPEARVQQPQTPIILPDVPALCVNTKNSAILSADGELLLISHKESEAFLKNQNVLLCNAPYTKKRLDFQEFYAFDVLELFAFIYPTRFCVPTPAGLCKTLFLEPPSDFDDMPMALMEIATGLLSGLRDDFSGAENEKRHQEILDIANAMGKQGKGWNWTPFIFAALGEEYDPSAEAFSRSALNVWKNLPEWADEAPEASPSHHGVSPKEAHERLDELLLKGDKAEERTQQKDYAAHITKAFEPVQEEEQSHIVLAEAGTGIGKTLGYLAPASVWAEKNDGAVWVSTYTKNLQRQIDNELDRLYPHPQVKDAYVTVRKGRENYLCLLNYEELSNAMPLSHNPRHAVAAGLMARWASSTKDGDLSGSDFPGWLAGILGYANTYGLADKRGECIFSACDHYHRCFVERSIRKAKRARLVIANHALVMIQSAMSTSMTALPTRYVFDEAHHLFDAADSAFSAHLTARETADLRRWILGAESRKSSRARGLKRRVEDLLEGDEEALKALESIIHAASALTNISWSRRMKDKAPSGVTEQFLFDVYTQVYARAPEQDKQGPYSLETGMHPASPDLLEKTTKLREALRKILTPMERLARIMAQRLAEDDGEMNSDTRKRFDSLMQSLEYRGNTTLKAWISLLESLEKGIEEQGFVDWMGIERIDGQAIDVGLFRHYVDPMRPFVTSIRPHAHGMAITSATLCDEDQDWRSAHERTGAHYLSGDLSQEKFASPFDYKANSKVLIINDVNRNDPNQVASAYKALFTASNGGGLGLFTSVKRLKNTYSKIAAEMEEVVIPLYAQHMDDMDVGTLIDIFRDEHRACLLGTDAVRDGIDVPGESLRLIVFDRVPWPRPNILHKARRELFGKRHYDEMVTRLKIKQAFGRLIRREHDKGIFVMLDSMFPSRLHTAFPKDVEIEKIGLSEGCKRIEEFLK